MARENFTHKNKKEDNGPNVCSLKFAQWGSCCLITKLADAILVVCIRNNSDDHKKVRQRLILSIASGGEGSWPDDDDGNDYH